QVGVERQTERRRTLPHLERRERMDVETWNRSPDRRLDLGVVVTRESRMDPALQAHLRRPPLPRLLAAADDLGQGDEVRGAAPAPPPPALGEGAEAAAEVADVRVLDVPCHDVAALVAADVTPQPIGGGQDALALRAARLEQSRQLGLPELLAAELERRR